MTEITCHDSASAGVDVLQPVAAFAGPCREEVRALLIDSDWAAGETLTRLASRSRQLAFDLTICRTVASAAAELLTARFDVIFIEYWLGAETSVAFLHATTSLQGPPCVVVTDLDEPDIRRVAFRAGAEAFLSKDSLSTQALESVTLAVLRARLPAAVAAY